ncbi:FAD/NAD(P)-binding protein [Chromohalobacter canadensis]|uniref:FAD/NAD(P)-binding protein n=1 Tax=Chromohalobacter canadensis TaxID=141389 RepID=UPI00240FEAC1|nr:FAD/NAD(P)-binding protein [Chromohalobacter canadensis]
MELGIIGDGASVVIVLNSILKNTTCSNISSITIYAARPKIGPGRAYQNDIHKALMNLPNSSLSLKNQESEYIKWCQRHPLLSNTIQVKKHEYSPRKIFGRYIAYTFLETMSEIKSKGVEVKIFNKPATSIDECKGKYIVNRQDSSQKTVNKLILGFGTSKPKDFYNLANNQGYIASVYPLSESLYRILDKDRVAIIGSGLTAVDIAKSLLEGGHKGRIFMATRYGNLPRVRNALAEYHLTHTNMEILTGEISDSINIARQVYKEIYKIAKKEHIELEHFKQHFLSRLTPEERLSHSLLLANSGENTLETILKILHPNIEKIWQKMSNRQAALFLDKWERRFRSFMNPMPIETANTLKKAIQKGQLVILSGTQSINKNRYDEFDIRHNKGISFADKVYNAASPEYESYGFIPSNKKILERFSPCKGEHSMYFNSLSIDPSTGSLKSNPDIYLIGQPTANFYYLTNSLEALSRQANIISKSL